MKKKNKPIELHPVKNRSRFIEGFRTFIYGHPPKIDGKSVVTGKLSDRSTKVKVTKQINEVLEKAKEIKIGVTGDIEVRMDGTDYREEFNYVSRIYKTSSKINAIEYEVELIKKYKKSHPDKVKNDSETKAGRLTTYNGFYYIYVVFNLDDEG